MGDFNDGLRIEVENDLYHDDGGNERMDEDRSSQVEESMPTIADEKSRSSLDDSDKEDGELSGPEDNEAMDLDMKEANPAEVMNERKTSNASFDGIPDSLESAYKPRTYPNPFADDILVSEAKLSVRAARFGVQSDTPKTVFVEQPLPTDDELLKLYTLLGLIEDDGGEPSLDKVGKQYRLGSILIRGTNEMSTNDIFAYLRDHNQRPAEMEWVNDACCVVIYKNKYQAARTLLNMTKPIHLEPKPERKTEAEDGETEDSEEMMQDVDFDAVDSVSSRYVTVAMPPGHTWRFAVPCAQARGILMRYATVQDKKQEKAERHSEYYKKFGNPNYPAGYGIVTKSFRDRLQKKRSFERPPSPQAVQEEPLSNKAAWTQLSHRWNDEENGSVTGYKIPQQKVSPREWPIDHPVIERKTSGGPGFGRKNFKIQVEFEERAPSIKARLKRRNDSPPRPVARNSSNYDDESDSDEDDERWRKKLKVPRMRMHADEEEQKMKLRQKRNAGLNLRRGHASGRMSDRLTWFDARERIPRENEDLE